MYIPEYLDWFHRGRLHPCPGSVMNDKTVIKEVIHEPYDIYFLDEKIGLVKLQNQAIDDIRY
jgi:hypothetical protein